MPGLESLSWEIVAWIVFAVALGGISQGALGLGFPMIATPLVALVTDMRTAVVMVLVPCLACVFVSTARSGPLGPILARFWVMPIGMLAGAAMGTQLFVAYPAFPYALLLALMISAYLLIDWIGRGDWPLLRAHARPFALPFSIAAGMSEGTANIAAPALIVYYLGIGLAPAALVQGLNICFITGKTTQLVVLSAAGGVSAGTWLATLPLAAVGALTTLYGANIRSRIDAATYRRWLKYALGAIAFMLLAQELAVRLPR